MRPTELSIQIVKSNKRFSEFKRPDASGVGIREWAACDDLRSEPPGSPIPENNWLGELSARQCSSTRCPESQSRGRGKTAPKRQAAAQEPVKGLSTGTPDQPQRPLWQARWRHIPSPCP